MVVDGTCESGHTCLGLLAPGVHREDVFIPGFSFSTTSDGWENLAEAGGDFGLKWIEHPGDMILFFRSPRPTTAGGTLVPNGATTVDSLGAWLAANPDLSVTLARSTTVSGLKGVWMDITLAPTANHPGGGCPTQTCVEFLKGTDRATWEWDWGTADFERQRLYLLDPGADVLAIVVDSADGTTFDALTREADGILGSVTFDTP